MFKGFGGPGGWRRLWIAATIVWGAAVLGLAVTNEIRDRETSLRQTSWLGSSGWAGYSRAIQQLDDPKCLEALARYSRESNPGTARDYHDNCAQVAFRLKMRPPMARQAAIDWLLEARALSAFVSFPGTVIAVILVPSLAFYLAGRLVGNRRG